jgi:serine/threonine protein kinase
MQVESKSIDILADRVDRLACAKCGHHMDLTGVEPFSGIACPKCGTRQVAPMRLSSFLLIEEMGRGGMGSVYRAFDQTLGRYVAIKVMQRQLAENKTFSENFVREARAAAALNHPHVVQIYSCSQEKGQLYIAMELVDGGRLDQMIEGGKALDEVFTLEVGVQVAQGLEAANEIGLIHGDIKPANILFDKQHRAKVVDFGLARFAAQQTLQPGEIWGTPYYIAPEKVRAQKEDHRADIYSLGATLFHVLTGQPPFDGDTAKDVVLARLKGPAPGLQSLRPSLQTETADVIARALEADPARRYPTYKSLLADLEEALRVARQRHGMPAREEESSSKAPFVIGVLLAVALGAGAFMFLRDPPKEAPTLPARLPPGVRLASTNTQAAAEAETVDTELADQLPVQPFSDEMQELIGQAVAQWVAGDERDYDAKLRTLAGEVPAAGVERVWVMTLQAVPAWAGGRQDDAMDALRGIQDAQLRELPDNAPHPGAMPRELARFIAGMSDEAALRDLAESWPDWFSDWVDFFVGADHLRSGRVDAAREMLAGFAGKAAGEVVWPYHYQQMAHEWLSELEEWQELAAAVSADTPEDAIRRLEVFRRRAARVLYADIDRALEAARARQAQAAEAARRAAEEEERAAAAAYQARVDGEMERVQAVRERLLGTVMRERDFRDGARRAADLAGELETDEGKAALDRLIERYRRMDALRAFLIRGMQQSSAPAGLAPELPRETVGASSSGIRMVLGRDGYVEVEWGQVSNGLMAVLANYYIQRLPSTRQGGPLLDLAVFAYENQAVGRAVDLVRRAVELDRDLEARARQLMPDLDW